MNLNYELILFYASVVTGLIALADIVYFAPRRKRRAPNAGMPLVIDYARAFFPVLVIVFLLRSFLFEPFRIPSTSLEPTLLMGDFILVNKFEYGVRLPVVHKKIMAIHEPKRGDILVFRWPPNPSVDFIKRVIGLPGDHISYVNKQLFVNGTKVPQTALQEVVAENEAGQQWNATEKEENLLGVSHHIYLNAKRNDADFKDLTVPAGMYFVMGDNRDNSADSRYFGFVPDENVVGKAILIWASWDKFPFGFRWGRVGKVIR